MISKLFFHNWIYLSIKDKDITWTTFYDSINHNLHFDEFYQSNFNKVKGDIFEYFTKYIYLYQGHQTYLYNEINLKTLFLS
jgi:hypothetical protein